MNDRLDAQIEAILFAAAKPFTMKRLAEVTSASPQDVKEALVRLAERFQQVAGGIMLQQNGTEVELVTRPETAEVVKQVVRADSQGELTRAALEALTILAYRGPLTRPELEQIRGVQSSMILRNLMMRGLIEEKEDTRLGQPIYAITFEFLNHLGLSSVDQLPEYQSLRGHAAISDVLDQLEASSKLSSSPESSQASV